MSGTKKRLADQGSSVRTAQSTANDSEKLSSAAYLLNMIISSSRGGES